MGDFDQMLRGKTFTGTEASHSLWTVSSNLFSVPYWERLWIIQEVALAPSVLFYYGEEALTTAETLKLGYLTSRGLITRKLESDIESDAYVNVTLNISRACHRLYQLRPLFDSKFPEKPRLNGPDLVRLAQSSKATDQRDKAFGLISLLPDSIATRIEPNYDPSFSAESAFTMFWKACFEAEGMGSLAGITKRPSLALNLPSWVIDLGAKLDMTETTLMASRSRIHAANLDLPIKGPSFSDNNRLLFCDGVIVDTIGSLGAVRGWIPELGSEVFSGAKIGKARDSTLAATVNRDWKLTLARVLTQDSNFEFSELPSVLDIPWVDKSEVVDKIVAGDTGVGYYEFSEEDKHWRRLYKLTPLSSIFSGSLYGNEEFDIGGKPLKSYFTSTDTICPNPADFMELAHDLMGGLTGSRLFTSQDGLLGTVPKHARLGDKIAILSSCDMPIVLRPNGKYYVLIGYCFVEGLMRGEVARGIKNGQFQIETLIIC